MPRARSANTHAPVLDTYAARTYVKMHLAISIRMAGIIFIISQRPPLYHLNNVIAGLPRAPARPADTHSGNNYRVNIAAFVSGASRCTEDVASSNVVASVRTARELMGRDSLDRDILMTSKSSFEGKTRQNGTFCITNIVCNLMRVCKNI